MVLLRNIQQVWGSGNLERTCREETALNRDSVSGTLHSNTSESCSPSLVVTLAMGLPFRSRMVMGTEGDSKGILLCLLCKALVDEVHIATRVNQ